MFRVFREALSSCFRRTNNDTHREISQSRRDNHIEPEMASSAPSTNTTTSTFYCHAEVSNLTVHTNTTTATTFSLHEQSPPPMSLTDQNTTKNELSTTSLKRKRSLSTSSSTTCDAISAGPSSTRRRVETLEERFVSLHSNADESCATQHTPHTTPAETGEQADYMNAAKDAAIEELSTLHDEEMKLPPQPAELVTQPLATQAKTTFTTPAKARRNRARRECLACGNETSRQCPFPAQKVTSTCDHDSSTCKPCLRKWIATQLGSTTWDSIQCPECSEVLQNHDIQLHASPSIFRRVDNMALASFLRSDETFFSCLSPTCNAGQLHPGGASEPIFNCASCQTRSCVACRTLWHDGRTCEQHQQDLKDAVDRDNAAKKVAEERKAQEAASEKAIKALSKICPNGNCGARIEKNGGCDHMTCGKCHYEFCWLCFVDFNNIRRDGNEAHGENCRWRNPGSNEDMIDEDEYQDEDDEEYHEMIARVAAGHEAEQRRQQRLREQAEAREAIEAREQERALREWEIERANRGRLAREARERERQQVWQRQAQFGAGLQAQAVPSQQPQTQPTQAEQTSQLQALLTRDGHQALLPPPQRSAFRTGFITGSQALANELHHAPNDPTTHTQPRNGNAQGQQPRTQQQVHNNAYPNDGYSR